MIDLCKPTIHRNGTPRQHLGVQLENVANALRLAVEALTEAEPNGRDYYPQGPEAFARARRESASRLARLLTVQDEIRELWEHVANENL